MKKDLLDDELKLDEILKSYELQANCYLSKPVELEAFDELVRSINDFWVRKVKLPQQIQS